MFDPEEAVKLLLFFLVWLFAPTICVVVLACVLSILRIKPPKPRRDGWFGPW